MTPNDFLRVIIDVVVDSLQVGRRVALPGIGLFEPTGDDSDPVRFTPSVPAEADDAVETLAASVARRTGHDVDSARTGLQRFGNSVLGALERGAVDLPGLGSFRVGRDGVVGFIAAPGLVEAVAWRSPTTTGVTPHPPSTAAEDPVAAGNEVPVPSPLPPEEPRTSAGTAARARPVRRRQGSGTGRLVAAVAAVFVLAAIAFGLSRRSGRVVPIEPPAAVTSDPNGLAAANADSLSDPVDPATGSADSLRSRGVVPDTTVSLANVGEPVTAAGPSAGSEPLTGEFDIRSPGFTLITASTTRPGRASLAARAVSGLGYPVAVLAYTVDGSTRYRVGLGRFPSIGAADSVRSTLRDRLPAGTWVRRIRP